MYYKERRRLLALSVVRGLAIAASVVIVYLSLFSVGLVWFVDTEEALNAERFASEMLVLNVLVGGALLAYVLCATALTRLSIWLPLCLLIVMFCACAYLWSVGGLVALEPKQYGPSHSVRPPEWSE